MKVMPLMRMRNGSPSRARAVGKARPTPSGREGLNLTRRQDRRGVALVITLIMLSIITVLAVSFLALSRRDRASVAVAQTQTGSRLMAEAAQAHAQAEVMSRVVASGNSYAAYASFAGFPSAEDRAAGLLVSTNVDIAIYPGRPVAPSVYIPRMTNLQWNARAPVFVNDNVGPTGNQPLEERFYLDFNRNGIYDPSGWTNNLFYSGDPEWIGVLEHPEFPHSATNRFVGRYAYMVLPVGNSLDLNYIHNYARGAAPKLGGGALPPTMIKDGFSRNQGIGSWEINLAAFLTDLDPFDYNGQYSYGSSGNPGGVTTSGQAFNDSVGLLKYRYGSFSPGSLASVSALYGNTVGNLFANDFIDSYSLSPVLVPPYRNLIDTDVSAEPWVGASAPNRFVDPQSLFTLSSPQQAHFTNVLFAASRRPASDDRYMVYRMLSQLSTGTEPELKGKINLNFSNNPALNTSQTAFLPWVPTNFFKTAGQALLNANLITVNLNSSGFPVTNYVSELQSGGTTTLTTTNFLLGGILVYTNFSVTNIEIYPNNQYTPLVHQLLQVAANLYDSTTNRYLTVGQGPYFPSVFRPVIARQGNRIYIRDWVEVTNGTEVINLMNTNTVFYNPDPKSLPAAVNVNTYVNGLPFVIGAKKGFPNFNELAMASTFFAQRKLQVTRPRGGLPNATNQMFLLQITNSFAVEGWNSYSNTYPRNLRLTMTLQTSAYLSNSSGTFGTVVWPPNGQAAVSTFSLVTNIPANTWLPKAFMVPLVANLAFLTNSIYTAANTPPLAGYNNLLGDRFDPSSLHGFPNLQLYYVSSNTFRYALEDVQAQRIVDYVTFTNLSTVVDIAAALQGVSQGVLVGDPNGPATAGQFWLTNRLNNSKSTFAPTLGIINQIRASMGGSPGPYPPPADPHWGDETSYFAQFLAKAGSGSTLSNSVEAPFSPYQVFTSKFDWEVNDPLVHYVLADITDPVVTNNIVNTTALWPVYPGPAQIGTIGSLNTHYRPWGGNPNNPDSTSGLTSFQWTTMKDPGVTSSDAWDFPTNRFASVGTIGRVHRGTPWQTIYLKSAAPTNLFWYRWGGSLYNMPTNDWRMVDLFTTALNDNAATGLLPVNQPNLPAWSAVLSGVVALENTPAGLVQPQIIAPASTYSNPNNSPVATIVSQINTLRSLQPAGVFHSVGQILQAPALTDASPFLYQAGVYNYFNTPVTDEMYERIPQQILSLLRVGQPRFAIYSYGQTLKPANGSLVLDGSVPGAFNVCTNYQIIGESAYRTVFRLEGNPSRPNVVIESSTPLAPQ